jgi:hypothetical protein
MNPVTLAETNEMASLVKPWFAQLRESLNDRVGFPNQFAASQVVTKMTPQNVAICFAQI